MEYYLKQDFGYIKAGTEFVTMGNRWLYPKQSLPIEANVMIPMSVVRKNRHLFGNIKDKITGGFLLTGMSEKEANEYAKLMRKALRAKKPVRIGSLVNAGRSIPQIVKEMNDELDKHGNKGRRRKAKA